jgi:hypothetical protein
MCIGRMVGLPWRENHYNKLLILALSAHLMRNLHAQMQRHGGPKSCTTRYEGQRYKGTYADPSSLYMSTEVDEFLMPP